MPSAANVTKATEILKGLTREELLVVVAGLLEERGPFERKTSDRLLAELAYDALERREAAAREADEAAFGVYAAGFNKLRKGGVRGAKQLRRAEDTHLSARGTYDRLRALRGRLFDLAWGAE